LHSLCPPLVHRDIKSPNIFLTHKLLGGVQKVVAETEVLAKIGDFGLSTFMLIDLKLNVDSESLDRVHPRWVAPEVLSGHLYSLKSDIYSIGLVLWELRSRQIPFAELRGQFEAQKIQECVTTGNRPILIENDKYDDLCSRCWGSDPAIRPQCWEIHRTLREIAQIEAPELLPHLPFLAPPSHESQISFIPKTVAWQSTIDLMSQYHSASLSNSSILPAGDGRSHRIICSALARNFLWVGCRSGMTAVINTSTHDPPLFANVFQLKEDRPSIRAMAFIRATNTVWTGSDAGDLQVWSAFPAKGVMHAESMYYAGDVVIKKLKKKKNVQLQLVCGTLTWRKKHLHRSRSPTTVKVSILEDLHISTPGEFSFTLLSTVYRVIASDAEEWVRKIKQCRMSLMTEWTLVRKGEFQLRDAVTEREVPIVSLQEIDGAAWSVDGSLRITEWKIEINHVGTLRGVPRIVPTRFISLDPHLLKSAGAIQPAGLLNVRRGELWVVLGDQFARIQTNNNLGATGPFSQQIGSVSNQNGKPSRAEIIDSAVVVQKDNETEVWSTNAMGELIIWAVEGKEKMRFSIGEPVYSMALIKDEVFIIVFIYYLILTHSFSFLHNNRYGLEQDQGHSIEYRYLILII
jgi:hypothetical protein